MPFGLDLKSFVLGILIAWFVIPYLTTLLHKQSKPSAPTV